MAPVAVVRISTATGEVSSSLVSQQDSNAIVLSPSFRSLFFPPPFHSPQPSLQCRETVRVLLTLNQCMAILRQGKQQLRCPIREFYRGAIFQSIILLTLSRIQTFV